MDFELSEDQRMLQSVAREIVEDYGLEYWREKDEVEEFLHEIWGSSPTSGSRASRPLPSTAGRG